MSGPSGIPIPQGDILGWHQIFYDDFTTPVALGGWAAAAASGSGTPYAGRWGGYSEPFVDTSNNGVYTKTTTQVTNSCMQYTLGTPSSSAYTNTSGGVAANVAAPIPILPGNTSAFVGQRYARRDVCMMVDSGLAGFKVAWLLWPDDGIWKEEIDFPEGNLNSTVGGHVHVLGNPSANAYNLPAQTAVFTAWHVYTTIWTPAGIQFLLDGTVVGSYTAPNGIPLKSMHWIMQTETQLSGGPPSPSVSGNVYIDWISIYSQGNSRFAQSGAGQRLRLIH